MKLPTAAEMRQLDRTAIEDFGIPGIVLMENAGLGTVRMMIQRLGPCANTFALIFIGPGNNGGDGFVIGRHLYQRGCQPIFFLLINPDSLTGDAAVNFSIIKNLKLPFHIIDSQMRVETIPILVKQIESRGLPCYAVIDAIFGIGLTRDICGHFADTVDLINRSEFARNVPVVAVDVPSGLDADRGRVMGTCIAADYTATYGFPKPCHFIQSSSDMIGSLTVIDIGIPPEAVLKAGISTELITRATFNQWTKPLIRDKGAAILAARGALRAGCGLVSLCVPHSLNPIFEASLVEAMTVPLRDSPNYIGIADRELILESINGKKAVVLGPGLGTNPQTAELVLYLYHTVKQALVIDADALNILAEYSSQISEPAGPRIFTPHPGELSRLINTSVQDIQDNRLTAARNACSAFKRNSEQIIMILKGAGTIVATDAGTALVNTTGNPGMATGGMGDVLSGIIGALICQGLSPLCSAATAIYLHGAAADDLYERTGFGYTAGEVADILPLTLKRNFTEGKSYEESF